MSASSLPGCGHSKIAVDKVGTSQMTTYPIGYWLPKSGKLSSFLLYVAVADVQQQMLYLDPAKSRYNTIAQEANLDYEIGDDLWYLCGHPILHVKFLFRRFRHGEP